MGTSVLKSRDVGTGLGLYFLESFGNLIRRSVSQASHCASSILIYQLQLRWREFVFPTSNRAAAHETPFRRSFLVRDFLLRFHLFERVVLHRLADRSGADWDVQEIHHLLQTVRGLPAHVFKTN